MTSKKKTLVVFFKQLGDVITLEPALERLALGDGCAIDVAFRSNFQPLIELMPNARKQSSWQYDRVLAYDFGSKAARHVLFTISSCKQLLIPDEKEKRLIYSLAYKRIICDPYNQRYIGRYYWDNTPGTQDHVFRPPRLLKPSAKWAQDLSLPQEPYIVLNPCSAWRRKCYPVDRWLEIVQKLSEMGFAKKIVLLGGQESWHAEFNNQIASHPAVINLTGQTNLRQYIYTISRASLILTVDGSASHLAQAFERPCLTLFGASYEHRWHYPEPYHEMLSSRSYAPTEDRPPAEKIDQKDVLRIMENMVSDCKSL